MAIIDEYTREILAIDVARQLRSDDVLAKLTELFTTRGNPDHIGSDNGPEFTARAVRDWLTCLGVRKLFIEPGSPWENGYSESFNGKLRDEPLNGEIFDTLLEAKMLMERWRVEYNTRRPHSLLGSRPPAPETIEPFPPGSGTSSLRQGQRILDRGELKKMNAILSDLRKSRGGEAEYRETLRDHLVTVNEFTTTEVGIGKSEQAQWMRVEVYYNQPLDAGLRISPETWAAKLWKLFGTQDVKTGDEEFDQTFLVHAASEVEVEKRLTASARQALLSFYRSALAKVGKKRTFEVLDNRIVFSYSAWGYDKHRPTEVEKQKLINALVDVAVAIDESCR